MASIAQQIVEDSNFSKIGATKYGEEKKSLTSVSGDDFLLLMTEQLKYQDPMNPMDNNDMLAQEAQFQSLSQMEELNKCFSQFSNVFQANSLLGQCVRVEVDGVGQIGIVEGVNFNDVNGASVFVGDRYYPMSAITNVYWLTADGSEPEPEPEPNPTEENEKKLTEEAQSKNKNSDISSMSLAKYITDVPNLEKTFNKATEIIKGDKAKKAYETVKNAINKI